MAGYFTEVRGSPLLKPAIIEELLARHAIDRARSVMVGDAPTDYHAALETGIAFIGRVPPGRPSPFPEGTRVVPDLSSVEDPS